MLLLPVTCTNTACAATFAGYLGTCPSCQTKRKGLFQYEKWILIGGAVWFFILMIWLKTLYVSLDFTCTYDGKELVVTNTSDFDWRKVKLDINGGFITLKDKMQAGKTYRFSVDQFAKVEGYPFNPARIVDQKLVIHCQTDDGQGLGDIPFVEMVSKG